MRFNADPEEGFGRSAQILLHRQFVAPARSKLLALPSLLICSNSARSIAKILEAVRDNRLLGDAFYWLPLVCGTAGIVLLTSIFSQGHANAPPQGSEGPALTSSASNDLDSILEVTVAMGKVSNMAFHFATAMSNLLQVVKAHLARKGRSLYDAPDSAAGSPVDQAVAVDGARVGVGAGAGAQTLPATTDELRQEKWNG